MKPRDLRSVLLREHYLRSLEGTNNLLFYFATSASIDDKRTKLPPTLVNALNLPPEIKSMYDYRSRYNGIYERLYQHCVISLCSDIEFMFKALFAALGIQPDSGRGFFQRFTDVIVRLEREQVDFSTVDQEIQQLRLAFSVRHIAIHNFGHVDQPFVDQTGLSAIVGEQFVFGQREYRAMFDGYCSFLKCLDGQINA